MAFYTDENLSKRIHSLRFILIAFVVFIHNGVIDEGINFAGGTQNFTVPLYVSKIKEFIGTLTCTAVPLYFITASVFLYSKEISYKDNLKKKCGTVLLPYFLWTALEILFLFTAQNISWAKQYFANVIIKDFSVWDWIGSFTGKSGMFTGTPLNYPLWFLRDLFILNIGFPVIKRIIDTFPAAAFIMLFMVWTGGINIYIVSPAALFFFAMGYYIVKYNIDYKHLDKIKIYDMSIMYGITITARLFFGEIIPILIHINILTGVLFLIRCSRYLIKNRRMYQMLLGLEKQQFFIYAAHGVFLAVLVKGSSKIMPMNGGWLLIHYFGICILCIIILAGIGNIIRKLLPKVFSVLTGGR